MIYNGNNCDEIIGALRRIDFTVDRKKVYAEGKLFIDLSDKPYYYMDLFNSLRYLGDDLEKMRLASRDEIDEAYRDGADAVEIYDFECDVLIDYLEDSGYTCIQDLDQEEVREGLDALRPGNAIPAASSYLLDKDYIVVGHDVTEEQADDIVRHLSKFGFKYEKAK
jgi:hypothetical protein